MEFNLQGGIVMFGFRRSDLTIVGIGTAGLLLTGVLSYRNLSKLESRKA